MTRFNQVFTGVHFMRRVGLAVGAGILAYNLAPYMNASGAAFGAVVFAFFIPSVRLPLASSTMTPDPSDKSAT
jgi:hypothetical protein